MARVVRRRSEATKERILSAALKLMARSGYHGAKTKAIATEAGVNEALIFRYFGSKKELLKALIEKNRMAETIAPFDKPKDYSLVSFLQAAARSTFVAYENNPDFFRLLRFTLLEEPDMLKDYFAHYSKNRLDPFLRFLAKARQQGLIRGDLAPELQAQVFGGLLYHMLEQRILGLNPLFSKLTVKASVDLVVDHFLQGSNPLAFRPSGK